MTLRETIIYVLDHSDGTNYRRIKADILWLHQCVFGTLAGLLAIIAVIMLLDRSA